MPIPGSAVKRVLLEVPGSMLDAAMLPYVQKWSEPPQALEVLEVLDHCIHGALASGLVVQLLQQEYGDALKREYLSHGQLVPLATWRDA